MSNKINKSGNTTQIVIDTPRSSFSDMGGRVVVGDRSNAAVYGLYISAASHGDMFTSITPTDARALRDFLNSLDLGDSQGILNQGKRDERRVAQVIDDLQDRVSDVEDRLDIIERQSRRRY